jgi:hypothetical protein
MKAVWEGGALDKGLNPSSQPPGGFETYFSKKCLPRESDIWQAAFKLFGSVNAERMYEACNELFQKEISKYANDEFGVYEFTVRNLVRNRTIPNPLVVYANYVLPFTPGFSKAFWDVFGGISYKIKTGGRVYFEIFRRYFQHIEDIPIISGDLLYLQHSRGQNRWIASAIHWLDHSHIIQELKLKFYRLITGTWQYWPESDLIPRIISRVNPVHPELNNHEVQALMQSTLDPSNIIATQERRLLFYWQVWRWIAEGKLTKMNKDIILLK